MGGRKDDGRRGNKPVVRLDGVEVPLRVGESVGVVDEVLGGGCAIW